VFLTVFSLNCNMSKRKTGQLSIASWCKRPATDQLQVQQPETNSEETTTGTDNSTAITSCVSSVTTPTSSASTSQQTTVMLDTRPSAVSVTLTSSPSIFDFGFYLVGGDLADKLNDDIRFRILTQRWLPNSDYQMPYSVRNSGGKQEKRFLRREHLERCPFLGYSPSRRGIYCLPCVLFGPASATAGRSCQNLGKLVTEPLTQFHRLFGRDGYLTTHESLEYHKSAMVRSDEFKTRFSAGTTVDEDVDKASSEQAAENRRRLAPVVKTILFCARQNIAFRGHRDDGNLMHDEDARDMSVVRKDGNFRALLKFCIDAGDETLRQHLESSASNATYISKTTQNELIKAAGDVVRQKILDRVAAARFFTILADETTDASRSEMMSFCVRYADSVTKTIREDFLDFVKLDDMTGEGLANVILRYMTEQNMNAAYLVGQGYDGASAMSGKYRGVQAAIRRQYSAALYVHCASHCLNLTLCKSCEHQAIRNATGVIQQTANFDNASARRVAMISGVTRVFGARGQKQ